MRLAILTPFQETVYRQLSGTQTQEKHFVGREKKFPRPLYLLYSYAISYTLFHPLDELLLGHYHPVADA